MGQGPQEQSGSVENCLLCLGSWLSLHAPHTSSLPPSSLPFPLSLSFPGWAICSESQANLTQCWTVCSLHISLLFCGQRFMKVRVWEFQRVWWRAWSVTPSPLLVISVEWPDRTARSAPRPSMVSDCMELGSYFLCQREYFMLACFQDFAFTCPSPAGTPALLFVAWVNTDWLRFTAHD